MVHGFCIKRYGADGPLACSIVNPDPECQDRPPSNAVGLDPSDINSLGCIACIRDDRLTRCGRRQTNLDYELTVGIALMDRID